MLVSYQMQSMSFTVQPTMKHHINLTPSHFLSFLIASMGLQVIWSFGLAFMDAYALLTKKVLHNPVLVSLFVVGDWVST